MESLLPKNSTPFEFAIELILKDRFELDFNFSDLWDPDKCPANFLPYLAWAERVEIWDRDFVGSPTGSELERRRRQIIKDFRTIRALRGTIQAMDMALATVGVKARFKEWWEYPEGKRKDPFTFIASISNLENEPIGYAERQRIIRILNSLKPLRSSFELKILYQQDFNQGSASLMRLTRVKRMTWVLARPGE